VEAFEIVGPVREVTLSRYPMIDRKRRKNSTRFAFCVDSGEYPASLEPRKLYEIIPDANADQHGQLRVIDESGEDYLYPLEYFKLVELPPALNRLVRKPPGRSAKRTRQTRRVVRIRTAS